MPRIRYRLWSKSTRVKEGCVICHRPTHTFAQLTECLRRLSATRR